MYSMPGDKRSLRKLTTFVYEEYREELLHGIFKGES